MERSLMEEILESADLGADPGANDRYTGGTVVYGAPFTPEAPALTADAACNQVSRGRALWVSHNVATTAESTPTMDMLRRGCRPTGQTRVVGSTLQTQWCCPGPLVGSSVLPGAEAAAGPGRVNWGLVLLLLGGGAAAALLIAKLAKARRAEENSRWPSETDVLPVALAEEHDLFAVNRHGNGVWGPIRKGNIVRASGKLFGVLRSWNPRSGTVDIDWKAGEKIARAKGWK